MNAAVRLGKLANRLFRRICGQRSLNPQQELAAPLLAIAIARAQKGQSMPRSKFDTIPKTAREPIGRPQRSQNANDPDVGPAQIKRLREAALRGLRDPEWGSELGRLFLENKLDRIQYAAGKRWRFLATNYQNAIGIWPVRSAALVKGSPSTIADPNSLDGRRQAKREREAVERFFQAHTVLTATGTEQVVRELVERDCPPAGLDQLKLAQKGLSVLAMFWKLDKSK